MSVDIEGLIKDWAWDYFRRKAGRKERKLLEKDLVGMEIDWKRVKFTHEPPVYEPAPPKPGTGKPINNVLFNTNFTNKTDKPQTYTFKTTRTTRSSCTVEIENTYTLGMETSIKLATPCEIFEVNAGFHREISVCNTEEETIEEELSWGVDSEITVAGRHRAEAKLTIEEEEYKGSFKMVTKIKGKVRAIFSDIKDNNSFLKAVESDIDEIVKRARQEKRLEGSTVTVDGATRTVVCTSTGSCKFKYGLKQDVEVDQKPIDD